MALLFMDGFDAGDYALKWTGTGGAGTSASTRFSTGKSLQISTTSNNVYKLFTPSAQVIAGFAFTQSLGLEICRFYSDSGSTVHLTALTLGSGAIQLQRNGTILATTATGLVSSGQWNYFEISATISDTVGAVDIHLNGQSVLTFSGDTRNGGTSTNIDTIKVGSAGLTTNTYIDDFYLCDATGSAPYNTFLGDVRINTLSPTGAGSSTGFTPSAGANYTDVDELPYSATDYVTATASGTRDTYTMSDVTGSYTVLAVNNNVIAKKTDAGGTAIKSAIKSGGTVYYGTSTVLNSSDAVISDLRTTDPATSAAWTVTGVNALEAGMEIA